jgi:ribonuclease HI
LAPDQPGYIGAQRHTNNVGELSAFYFSLSWVVDFIASSPSSPSFIIEYDSEYAAGVAQRHLRGRANLQLVLRLRHLFDQVACQIAFRKVESHTGQFLNERADHLADCGACGLLRNPADVHRWASSWS